jgi:hypothetical protein
MTAMTAVHAPRPAQTAPAVHRSRSALFLVGLTVLGAAIATATGVWSSAGPGSTGHTSAHGELVSLYGEGLYRYDSELVAVGSRGSDAVTLLVLLPVMLLAARAYGRASLRGALLLSGLLGWTSYYYASMALGSALNRLLPLYVLLLGCSGWALVLVLRSVDVLALAARWPHRPPRPLLTGYLCAVVGALVLAWAPPLAALALEGVPPLELDAYTTTVTPVLDLGIVAPGAVAIALLLRRRSPLGLLLTAWMLAMNTALGLALLGQGAAQLLGDVPIATSDIVLKMASFAVLTGCAAVLLAGLLRGLGAPQRPAAGRR